MNTRTQFEFLKKWLETCNSTNNSELPCMIYYNNNNINLVIRFCGENTLILDKNEIETWQKCFNDWHNADIIKRKGLIEGKSNYIFTSKETIANVLDNLTEVLKIMK